MSGAEVVEQGTRNALRRRPVSDRAAIEARLRRANRPLGRRLGRTGGVGSFDAYIRGRAGLVGGGWTLDSDYLVAPPDWSATGWAGADKAALRRLIMGERRLWEADRGSHATARLTPTKRLPVYLNAIGEPALASVAAASLL